MGKNFKSHLENLSLVLQRIKDAGLRLKATKCAFFQDRVNYLGHVVSRDGVSVDQLKVNKVRNWPVPKTSKEVQQFLGLANYYWRFVQGFAKLQDCCTDSLRKRRSSPGLLNVRQLLMNFATDCVIPQFSHFLITRSLSSSIQTQVILDLVL